MLKKFRIGSTQKIMLKMPTDFTFSFDWRAFFLLFGKIAKIAVTFTVEILLRG